MKVTVTAPAKINLSLDIIGKRDDGYHLLNMILQSVELCDTVTRLGKRRGGGIELTCNRTICPPARKNLAFRAALSFFEENGLENPGIHQDQKSASPLGGPCRRQ